MTPASFSIPVVPDANSGAQLVTVAASPARPRLCSHPVRASKNLRQFSELASMPMTALRVRLPSCRIAIERESTICTLYEVASVKLD